jgi:hypothetical protein
LSAYCAFEIRRVTCAPFAIVAKRNEQDRNMYVRPDIAGNSTTAQPMRDAAAFWRCAHEGRTALD